MDPHDADQPTWTDRPPYGESYWIRLRHDGTSLRTHTSRDGITWSPPIDEPGAWLTVPLVDGMTEAEATTLARALSSRKPGEPVIMRRREPPAEGWRFYRAEHDGEVAHILGSPDGVYWIPLTDH